ncbi:MAG TPA: DUF418 domain-containing protein [Pyrinomonadaceae bacterium]|jgi:uncharacterized protein|nr:DUF418 domain-containing protein [Pyrinomonadaceae bacterium]
MAKTLIGPIQLNERIDLVDVLRGLAVGGILIGNLQWFSGYGMQPEALLSRAPMADRVVHFLVHFFIEGKFYSIFSLLFGFGFALQIARADERGDAKASLFKIRLLWLFVIGAAHATLLWAGDILSVYAVMGFILILFRKNQDETLLKWAAALVIVPVITYVVIFGLFKAFVPADALAGFEASQLDRWNETINTVTNGSWWELARGFNLQYLAGRWAGLVVQMRLPKILAMFLLGVWVYRKGILREPSAHAELIRKVLIYGGILGLFGNIALAALARSEAPFPPTLAAAFGVSGYAFGVPAMALAIIAAITTLWQNEVRRRVLGVLAPVGRMALTNYVLQTATCVTIFYGYGFGQFGKYGAASATLIALAIFAVQIAFSNIWLRYFAYGPMEWIWRQLTYGRQLPLRIKAAEAT